MSEEKTESHYTTGWSEGFSTGLLATLGIVHLFEAGDVPEVTWMLWWHLGVAALLLLGALYCFTVPEPTESE